MIYLLICQEKHTKCYQTLVFLMGYLKKPKPTNVIVINNREIRQMKKKSFLASRITCLILIFLVHAKIHPKTGSKSTPASFQDVGSFFTSEG